MRTATAFAPTTPPRGRLRVAEGGDLAALPHAGRAWDGTKADTTAVTSRECNAFTLIELLVVIAIISLLASILVPSLVRASELTRRAICGSNQRHTATAFAAYASENRQIFPQTGWNDPPLGVQKTANTYFWDMPVADKLLNNYLGNCELVYCPSYLRNNQYIEFGNTRTDPIYGNNHNARWWWYAWPVIVGYPTQWRIAGFNSATQPMIGSPYYVRSMNDDPTKMLLFGMEISYNNSTSAPTWGLNWEREHWGVGRPEGQNITYVDGHTIWRTFDTMTPNWSCGSWWWWWALNK